MSNPAPTLNQINAFNATQGTTIDFNIIGGTEVIRSNKIYIYDLSDNSLICTHLYVSTESIHELPPNTSSSIVYASGKSSADFTNNTQYYAQIQTFTDVGGTQGGSGLSVAKMFWCLDDPTLTINTIPSTISTTSYNVSATYNANTSVVSNIIQQYQFNLYSATGSLLQSSGVIVGSGEQQGTSTAYDISYNFTGLSVGSSYYIVVDVKTTQGMSVSAQSGTFTVSIDTPTLGEATVVNNACDGYISVTSNLSSEYGGSGSGDIVSFETDSENVFTKLQVDLEPTQSGSGTPSPTNIRPIRGHSGVNAYVSPTQSADDGTKYSQEFDVSLTPTSTDKVPYTFKAVGRDVYGDRESDKIVGGTVAWNQLIRMAAESVSKDKSGCHFIDNRDGSYTFYTDNGGATAQAYIHVGRNTVDGVKKDHIYAILGLVAGSSMQTWRVDDQYNGVLSPAIGKEASIVKASGNGRLDARLVIVNGAVITTQITIKPQYFDLTQMFGSTIADYIYSLEQANAGAGVAWFKKLFPKDYYPYDPGTLRSVEGVSAHETVGFNQWDEEWEVGGIDSSGNTSANTDRIRSKNFVPILPNTAYYFKVPSAWRIFYYDANMNFISYIGTYNASRLITTPNNAHYLKFYCVGTTYNHDICINLSDPTRNGEYEPYQKHTYPLDSSLTLRGLPKLDASNKLYYDGDMYASDGSVTRKYGVVDLGTLNWAYYSDYQMFYATVVGKKAGTGNLLCSKYRTTDAIFTVSNDKSAGGNGSNSTCYVRDSSFNQDAAAFKAAMSGVYLVYELATPTTERAEPFTNPQVVDNGGTEAYVTTGIVPVGHDTTYLTRDIFGGTLDLVTGVLTVDRAMVDFGSLNWNTYNGKFTSALNPEPLRKAFGEINMLCSIYKTGNYGSSASQGDGTIWLSASTSSNTLYVEDSRYSDPTAFKQAMNGVQLCYELATPQTYQLTPHQIQTLVGQNNVWSDAGDVELSYHIPITNLLVKRQDVADVSGAWLTLYSQPITQASDMDFTFIDFLNQHGKTYKYALVPLLTQTQSGVIVEIEGGYTVSDNVNSIFDGVYIADQTNVERVKAGVGYGNIDMNQGVGSITPIGSKYPIVITNSQNQYHNGSIRGTIVPNDFYSNGNLSRIDMVNKRDELEQFLTNKRAKIIKDWNGKMWLVMIMSNVACSFDDNYGMGMVSFSADWLEVGDPTNQQDLYNAGLINVGGV